VAKRIEAEPGQTIKWPTDGQYLGDWREGEKLAQNGRGMTWTDKSAAPGQRRQLLQLPPDRQEGDLLRHHRPSLYNYGKIRGVTDPAARPPSPSSQYTWGKLWNSKAYNACSNMPRFGHMGC
jgi:sulfur-oxidizing protein SoxX